MIRTFSPSALLGSMPPRGVRYSRPAAEISATMPPSVSVWASSSSASSSGASGFKHTSTPPFLVISGASPMAWYASITCSAAIQVYPVGLSMASSSTARRTQLSVNCSICSSVTMMPPF